MARKKGRKVKEYVFNVGQIVAAKVKGHPTWPGRVESVEPSGSKANRYVVRFFATNDISNKFALLKPFNAFTPAELACKTKRFREAIEIARAEFLNQEKSKFRKGQGRSKKVVINEEPVLSIAYSTGDSSQDEEQEEDEVEEDMSNEQQDEEGEHIPHRLTEEHSSQDQPEEHDHDKDRASPKEPNNDIRELDPVDQLRQDVEMKPGNETEATKQTGECQAKEEKELEAENITHVETNGTSYLPETPATPADSSDCPPTSEHKESDESPKDCSLNDLTSVKANADRGRRKSPIKLQSKPIQETKKELTIAKLKKKIEVKLEEKANLKKAILERKSFEKASKILPKFTLMFDPLAMSSQQLLKSPSNKNAPNQFITSIKNCEKHLDLLDKCLKVMINDYGKRQIESLKFRTRLVDIVSDLKELKGRPKSDPGSREASHILKLLKKHKTIKEFINGDLIPDSSSESVAERKENATKHERLSR